MAARRRLYLMTKPSLDGTDALLAPGTQEDPAAIVLLQDGVSLDPAQLPFQDVYILGDDAVSHHVSPSAPTISHRELLDMILTARTVVTL